MKQRVIPEVINGDKISALAITEPNGGSDVANLQTRAVRDGDHYVVNGAKTFITSGVRADYYTVAVRTGDKGYGGISLLLIEKGTPGFTVGRKLKKMGWWASDTAELFFEDCRVPAENLIGPENGGFYCIMSNFQMERLILAVTANSTAQLALDEAMKYVKEREAFGKKIGQFQMIQQKLADMKTRVEASRLLIYQAALAKMASRESGARYTMESSMAKLFASETAMWVTTQAIQIHGGMGYSKELPLERYFRDAKITEIYEGTSEIQRMVIARGLTGLH
jgi:acyl-CoA dehydrogenase